jgi:hypothetical protein
MTAGYSKYAHPQRKVAAEQRDITIMVVLASIEQGNIVFPLVVWRGLKADLASYFLVEMD